MTVEQKQCPKCMKHKPSKQFKRTLTLAQSRSLLRRPTLKTAQEVDSKYCKACQPKPKLTRKSVRNRISDGDIHPVIGANLLKEIEAKGRKAQSDGMRKVWQKRRDEVITPWLRSIRQQVVRKYNYYTAQLAQPRDTNLTDHALLDYETAKQHKAKLEIKIKMGEGMKMDLYPHINDYYTAVEKAALVKLKQAIPKDILITLRGVR